MKLVFKKDEEAQITVLQKVDGNERDFSYVDMIKTLLKSQKLEEPEIADGFTEAEEKSINSMVRHINEKLESIALEETE
jgi:hypothetical protein